MAWMYRCPECGAHFEKPQGLGAHRFRAHGIKGGKKTPAEVPSDGEPRIMEAVVTADVGSDRPPFSDQLPLILIDLAREILSLPKIACRREDLEGIYWELMRFLITTIDREGREEDAPPDTA